MFRMPSDVKSATIVPRCFSKCVHAWSKSLAYFAIDPCDVIQVSRVICADEILFHDNVRMIRTDV